MTPDDFNDAVNKAVDDAVSKQTAEMYHQRDLDQQSSYSTQLSSAEEAIRRASDEKLSGRVETAQKALSMAGQSIAGLAGHQKAQEALKPLATISQILLGGSSLALGGVFKHNARNWSLDKAIGNKEEAKAVLPGLAQKIAEHQAKGAAAPAGMGGGAS